MDTRGIFAGAKRSSVILTIHFQLVVKLKNVCNLSWLPLHTVRLLNAHTENSKILDKPSFLQYYRLAAVCASLRQLLFHTTHCVCFTVTLAFPLYTLCVLHYDTCFSTLHTVCASLCQSTFHTTHCVCFTATVAFPLYTLCVLHRDTCFSTLNTVCASLWQSTFHTTHCVCFTATVAFPLYTLCVIHCDTCFSTLHTVCASLRQLLFHSTHCACFTITLPVQSRG